ncbi:MAG: hypothetical protein A3J79_04435 [Elusimicrobia bacterium RIFOXYB2_FULL_62_6]|nr:MAG: hypothetical protein A3J79_04435 [Elusimicrobia bacterium RIFOXYB2_FULL_62_6]
MTKHHAVTATFCAALLAAAAIPSRAADVTLTVVTPSRSERSVSDIPGAITVILPQELAAAPGRTLDEKLTAVSGVNVSRSNGIYSYNNTVSLRGLSSYEQGRTLILLDGAPVNNSATGSVNWNRLNIGEVDRIEVFKGPASSLYGSNAAAGVINIISKKPARGFTLRAGVSQGTYDTYQKKAAAEFSGDKLYFSLNGSVLDSGGYISTPVSQRTAYTVRKYVKESDTGFTAGWKFSGDSSLESAYSYYDGQRGEGYKDRLADGNNRHFKTQSGRLAWKTRAGRAQWQAAAFYQDEHYMRTSESIKSNKYNLTETDGNKRDLGAGASASLPLGDTLNLTAGFDFRRGEVDTTDTNLYTSNLVTHDELDNRGRLRQYSPYAQAEKKLYDGRLTLLAGLRYDRAEFYDGYYNNPTNIGWSAVNGPIAEITWTRFSPKLAAGYKYSDRAEQYASYGRGFRPAPLEDLCLSLLRSSRISLSNTDLKPETVDTFETGFRLHPAEGLYFEPAAYFTKGKDFIYEINTGATLNINGVKPIYKKQNLSEIRVTGAELDAKYYFSGALSVTAGFAVSRSEITSYPLSTALEGKELVYSPRRTATAGLDYRTGAWNFQLGGKYKSPQYTDDANTARLSSYATAAAGIAVKLGRNGKAEVRADNIFCDRFMESESDLAPGRTFSASVEVKF